MLSSIVKAPVSGLLQEVERVSTVELATFLYGNDSHKQGSNGV